MTERSNARALELVTAWIACAYTALVMRGAGGRAAVLGLAALGTLVGARVPFRAFGQRFVLLALFAGAFVARGALLAPTPASEPFGAVFAVVSLMASVALAARLWFRAPEWGPPVSITLGFTAFLSTGQGHRGPLYVLAVAAFLAASVAWTSASDPSRPTFRAAFAPRRGLWAAAVAFTAVFTVAGAAALPWLHDKGIQLLSNHFDNEEATSGFSDAMTLDAMDGMLQSDEVALRVYGPSDEYLRGAVFNRYLMGRWVVAQPPPDHEFSTAAQEPPPDEGRVEVRRVNATPVWMFAPLRARGMVVPGQRMRAGPFGVLHPITGATWERLWFHRGERDAARVDAPGPWDTRVPRHIRPHLGAFAARWTRPTDVASVRAGDIARHLSREWDYSLSRRRDASKDPVVDFLERDRRGHCEYFASALALLCRMAKVPARVVTGYRVHERSPLGNHMIVRERNAHAWVEVWLDDDQWHTLDATPEGAARPTPTRWSRWSLYATEAASIGAERAKRWLSARSPLEIAAMLGALVGLFLFSRWWRSRGERARELAASRSWSTPLTCWATLERALAAVGIARPGHQTLESFAGALRADGRLGALRERLADATERYAALRYGAVGDERALAAELDALAAAVRAQGAEGRG